MTTAPSDLVLPSGIRLVGTLRAHTAAIGRIAWSPDGGMLASPSGDRTVSIWDARSQRHIHMIGGHTDGLRTAAFDQHGLVLASGSDDGTIKLWKVGSWQEQKSFSMPRCQAIAFSPREDVLAAGGDKRAAIFDISSGEILHELGKQTDYITSVAFDPSGSILAIAGYDASVQLWNVDDGSKITTLTGHTGVVLSVAFAPNGQLLASCGRDNTIKIWDHRAGNLIRTLEGHTAQVRYISFMADGRLLASKSRDDSVRLWDCESWTSVRVIPEPGNSTWMAGLAFHPSMPLLATVGSDPGSKADNIIHLWELDTNSILSRSRPASVMYTSAKIVLVGDSGVGKTGLGYRLATGTFKDHASTHGQQFWLLDYLGVTREDGAQCEAILWDLAGQPDYRLIHALFLDNADLALILFDPTRDDAPLHGVDYWLSQLGVSGAPAKATRRGREVILIAARADRGSPRMTANEIAGFCSGRGIHHYVVTSARTGEGVGDLIDLMRNVINWQVRPTTVTTLTFKWIKAKVLELKEGQDHDQVIISPIDLRNQLEYEDSSRKFTDAEMFAAVGHLVNHGYVALLSTSGGESRILLTPELLNNVGASIILEARRNPKGLGSLEEQRLPSGDYFFPELDGFSGVDRDILLDSAVAIFLKHNICFRETDPLSSRVYLIFPELINLKQPATKDAKTFDDGVAYTVTGAVENVYASLVVLMGFTDVFTRTSQWRNQAEYIVGDSLECGFRLEAEREGELDFVLYFGTTVGEPIRMLFQSLFESFLAGLDLNVHRIEPVICSKGHYLNRAVVRDQLAEANEVAFCTRCGERLLLPRADVPIQLTRTQAAEVIVQRRTVDRRSRFEQALFRLKTYARTLVPKEPSCFISYAWGNRNHERWVERELASDLGKGGITVILDRWDNIQIGSSVPRFVDRVERADRVVVVGTPLYRTKYDNNQPMGGFVLAAEGDLIGKRMISTESRKQTILPILLEGTEDTALPPLLQGRVYADFRRPEQYFLSAFELILSVYGIPSRDPFSMELREFVAPLDPARDDIT